MSMRSRIRSPSYKSTSPFNNNNNNNIINSFHNNNTNNNNSNISNFSTINGNFSTINSSNGSGRSSIGSDNGDISNSVKNQYQAINEKKKAAISLRGSFSAKSPESSVESIFNFDCNNYDTNAKTNYNTNNNNNSGSKNNNSSSSGGGGGSGGGLFKHTDNRHAVPVNLTATLNNTLNTTHNVHALHANNSSIPSQYLQNTQNTQHTPHTPHALSDGRTEEYDDYWAPSFELNDADCPLIFLEIGSHELRLGMWSPATESFELR